MSYFTVVLKPVGAVEAGLREGAGTWLPIVAYTAHRYGLHLLSQVGVDLLGRQKIWMVDVSLSEPVRRLDGNSLVFAFNWVGTETKVLFLEGHLEIAPMNLWQTHMALSATYEPTVEVARQLPDHRLSHRLAQATLRDFSERVARRLETGRLT